MIIKDKLLMPLVDVMDAVSGWFSSDLGKQLLAAELAVVDRIMPSIFGYHLLQVGIEVKSPLFNKSSASHKFSMLSRIELGISSESVIGIAEELPFASGCIDAVVLHHALDFAQSPHQVLREASRVLRPGGKLVIVGFNPASLWGVSRWLCRRRQHVPWLGHFISHRRLFDWLTLLELKEEQSSSGFYRPPVSKGRWISRLQFMEHWGSHFYPGGGAFYVMVACKETVSLTPVGMNWRRRLIRLPLTNRSTRKEMSPSQERVDHHADDGKS
jgi:SAM-dependent methyltransferase